MKFIQYLFAILMASSLVACGGGGGSPGVSGGGTNPGSSNSNTVTVADIIVSFVDEKATLNNTGSDAVQLRVTAVTAGGVRVIKAPIEVSVTNGGVFGGQTAAVNGVFETGDNGEFIGSITSPSNRANRTIGVTIKSGTITKTASVAVVGSKITVTPVPGAPIAGQAVALNIKLVDANDAGIPSTDLTISGNSGFAGVVRTDLLGNAIFNSAAPTATGNYTVNVSGSGVTSTIQLTVIPATGGGIPDAVGPIGPGALNANPTNIPNNITSESNNRSVVTFKVLNSDNQGVSNVRVRFSILPPGLGGGEKLSTGDTIVYTNAAGEVSSDYIPGQRSSPTDGVLVRACYGLTDAALATCSTFVDTRLTVAGQALNLSIFNNNTLEPKFNNTIYIQRLIVQLADAAGNPVRDAQISASVDVTHYGKGPTWGAAYFSPGITPPTRADTYATSLSDTLTPIRTIPAVTNTMGQIVTPAIPGFNVWCINEDLNRNGTRDVGEDLDADGVLEPRASDVIISAPNGNKTDANGQMILEAQWGQNLGRWIAYTVKATTNVAGSEGSNSRPFITDVLEADVRNGSFLTPPYGVNNCRTNN